MARGTFGERLKRERELREVTLEEITAATRIGPRFLEALENEDWEKLPGGVFNRGFVRSVARYLGLDEESFLGDYDMAHGPVVQTAPERNANHFSSRPKWIPFVVFLFLVFVLGGLVTGGVYAWRYYLAHHTPKQSTSSPAFAPSNSSTNTTLQSVNAAVGPNLATAAAAMPAVPLDLYVSAKLLAFESLPTANCWSMDSFPPAQTAIFPPTSSSISPRTIPARCCWN
jgi:cytoskeletal protein RodZ